MIRTFNIKYQKFMTYRLVHEILLFYIFFFLLLFYTFLRFKKRHLPLKINNSDKCIGIILIPIHIGDKT
jgi:uncharacterized membrane protein YjfL (UPF0719 family)